LIDPPGDVIRKELLYSSFLSGAESGGFDSIKAAAFVSKYQGLPSYL